MHQKIKRFLVYILPVIGISTLVMVGVIYSGDQPPSQNPPLGNVAPPITTSTVSQYKEGALGIGGVLHGWSNAIFEGNVGIGTTMPSAKLTVAGTIESTTGGFKFPDGTTQTTGGFTGSVFTRWGNATCPSGTTLLYSGFGFNEHYTQGGGGAEAICMKGGDAGAIWGGNYGDILYPLGTGDGSRMPPGISAQKEIKCAVCETNGPSFEMWGSWSCPAEADWKSVYVGYGMGAYYSGHGKSNRHCVDNLDFDSSVANNNWGDIWYGTVLHDNTDLPNKDTNYPTNKYVKCAMCVKSEQASSVTLPGWLVNLKHSLQDCTDKYGVLVKVSDGTNADEAYCNTNGNCFCKFVTDSTCDNASHPGWVQYNSWSTTQGGVCCGENVKCCRHGCGGERECTFGSHTWKNQGLESCKAIDEYCRGFPACCDTRYRTCYAAIAQIGCY